MTQNQLPVVRPGPKVGDEHPTRPGWFFTGRFDRKGNPLWYRPPNAFFRRLRPYWTQELYGPHWHVWHRLRDWIINITFYGLFGLFFLLLAFALYSRATGRLF